MNSLIEESIFFGDFFEFKNLDIFINEEIKSFFSDDKRISNIDIFFLAFYFFHNLKIFD